MKSDLTFWYIARIAALSAFFVISVSIVTGISIRTAFLGGITKNKSLLGVHRFTTWLWVPLISVHVGALVLDQTASVRVTDLFIPFVSHVPGGQLAIGLGTVCFLLVTFIAITSGYRRRMPPGVWLWLHRLTYPLFVLMVLHAELAGSDFSRAFISIGGWAVFGAVCALAILRIAGARVETVADER